MKTYSKRRTWIPKFEDLTCWIIYVAWKAWFTSMIPQYFEYHYHNTFLKEQWSNKISILTEIRKEHTQYIRGCFNFFFVYMYVCMYVCSCETVVPYQFGHSDRNPVSVVRMEEETKTPWWCLWCYVSLLRK